MKAIIIVELPDDADLTKYRANINIEEVRDCGYDYAPYTFRLYCPLKPLPQHREMFVGDRDRREVMLGKAYYKGWNACIDEMEGRENE